MTRETKVGMVVAGSFLCLVGVVVASRLSRKSMEVNNQPEVHNVVTPHETAPPVAALAHNHNPASTAPPVATLDPKHIPPFTAPAHVPPLANVPTPVLPPANHSNTPLPNYASTPQPAPPPLWLPGAVEEPKGKSNPRGVEMASANDDHEKVMKHLKDAMMFPGRPDDGDVQLPKSAVAKAPEMPKPPSINDLFNDPPPPPPGAPTALKSTDLPPADSFFNAKNDGPPPPPPFMDIPAPVKPSLPMANNHSNTATAAPSNPPAPPREYPKASEPSRPAPPAPFALNTKDVTNPSLAPMGMDNKPPAPANLIPAVNIARPNNAAPVFSAEMETYFCKPEDRSFEDVSSRFYGSPKYARALQEYNRDHPLAKEKLKQNSPLLSPNQQVFVPNTSLLERKFAALIDTRPAAPAPAAPVIGIGLPLNASNGGQAANIATVGRTVNPTVATSDPTKPYRVQGQGQFLAEIAQLYLGDQRRWSEIYRLNNNLRPEVPIPGGTEIRLPANANIP